MSKQSLIKKYLQDPEFASFVQNAYRAPEGYALRRNPESGETEMFVAGSRSISDWLWNAADTVLYGADKALNALEDVAVQDIRTATGIPIPNRPINIRAFEYLDVPRHKKQKNFQKIAEEHGVHTVYGHSRGGAYVADMHLPDDVNKVGLDSAMVIAQNTKFDNFNEGGGLNPLGAFDGLIGLTGEQNIHTDYSAFNPHQVWAPPTRPVRTVSEDEPYTPRKRPKIAYDPLTRFADQKSQIGKHKYNPNVSDLNQSKRPRPNYIEPDSDFQQQKQNLKKP